MMLNILYLVIATLLIACGSNDLAGKPVGDETTNGVSIRFVDSRGNSVASAQISLMPSWSVSASQLEKWNTDKNGRLQIDSLNHKSYWLEVKKGTEGLRIFVQAGLDSVYTLQNLGTLSGVAPIGSKVALYGSSRNVQVDSLGNYQVDSVPAGNWLVRVESKQGQLLQEASAQVLPNQKAIIPQGNSLLSDWSTWQNHFTKHIAPSYNLKDTLLVNMPVSIFIDNALPADTASMRIIDSKGNFIPFKIYEWNAHTKSFLLKTLIDLQTAQGETLHVVWGKNGIVRSNAEVLNTLEYGYWPLENNAGPSLYLDSLTSSVLGRVGYGREFMGNSAMYIKSPTNVLDSFSLSCWIKYSGEEQKNYAKVVHMGWPDIPFGTLMIDIDTATNLPAFQVAQEDSQYVRIVTKPQPARDDSIFAGKRWVHVAATWSSLTNEAMLYIDGELQGVAKTQGQLLSHINPTHYDLILGNQLHLQAGFKGIIDEFVFSQNVFSPIFIHYQFLLE